MADSAAGRVPPLLACSMVSVPCQTTVSVHVGSLYFRGLRCASFLRSSFGSPDTSRLDFNHKVRTTSQPISNRIKWYAYLVLPLYLSWLRDVTRHSSLNITSKRKSTIIQAKLTKHDVILRACQFWRQVRATLFTVWNGARPDPRSKIAQESALASSQAQN